MMRRLISQTRLNLVGLCLCPCMSWHAGNHLSGSIPPQLFHLPLIRYLYLHDHSFNSGEVRPDDDEEIGNLTTILLELSLSRNKFSDVMLLSVLCLKGLNFLDLSYNDLCMEIPVEIGNLLPSISFLALSDNRLTGGIRLSMQKLSMLEGLYLQNNLLTGEIPSWLLDFKGLGNLYVGETV